MRKSFLQLAALFMFITASHAQLSTVSGNVKTGSGTYGSFKRIVRFTLKGCGGNAPSYSGNYLVSPYTVDFTPDTTTGAITGNILRNDYIACGGTTDSNYWSVNVIVNGVFFEPTNYRITSATFNLNSATPMSTTPVVTAPTGDTTYLRLDAGNTPSATADFVVGTLNNIRFATAFSGADLGAKIVAAYADLPSTGGTILVNAEGAQTWGSTLTVTQSKPVKIVVGCAAITSTVSPMVTVNGAFWMEGANRTCTTVTSSSAGTIFDGSASSSNVVRQFVLKNISFVGSGNAKLLVTPSSPTANVDDWSVGRIIFDNVKVSSFNGGSYAITLNDSAYFVKVQHSYFLDNTGSINIAWASDTVIEDTNFGTPVSGAQIKVAGGSHVVIRDGDMERNSAASTDPDIEINSCNTSGQSGYVWVQGVKFGGEGESASRIKIRNYCASDSTKASDNVYLVNNYFGCTGSTQKAIQLSNPIKMWKVTGNTFVSCGTLVDDVQTLQSSDLGKGIFAQNIAVGAGGNSPTNGWTGFTNGGRGFAQVELPLGLASDAGFSFKPDSSEFKFLKNRNSKTNFSANTTGWTESGVTTTKGVADPWGGTTAVTVTNANSVAAEFFRSPNIDMTSSPTRLETCFWGKAGSLSTVQAGLFSSTTSKFQGNIQLFNLDSEWRKHCFWSPGISSSDTYQVYFYPGTGNTTEAGTVSLACISVAEHETPCIITNGSAFVDATETAKYGSHFKRRISAPGGIYGEPVVGTDQAGNGLLLVGGLGTGNAVSGSVVVQAAPAGSTGTTVETPANRIVASPTKVSVENVPFLEATINTFANADTTPSVAGGNIFKTNNSGGTTITAFDDGQTGQCITIIFTDANTTVTDGGTIKLQGAANFVSTADDTMALCFDGTNWFERSRSVN